MIIVLETLYYFAFNYTVWKDIPHPYVQKTIHSYKPLPSGGLSGVLGAIFTPQAHIWKKIVYCLSHNYKMYFYIVMMVFIDTYKCVVRCIVHSFYVCKVSWKLWFSPPPNKVLGAAPGDTEIVLKLCYKTKLFYMDTSNKVKLLNFTYKLFQRRIALIKMCYNRNTIWCNCPEIPT